jgi:predicted nucleic acid-binding Zn ribbon protein
MASRRRLYVEPVPVGLVAKKIMAGFRHRSDGDLGLVLDVWARAVGDAIAANTLPVRLKGNILWVHVDSSVWIQELQFLKNDMLSGLNTLLEKELVGDIKFKIGRT